VTLPDFLAELRSHEIQLWADGDRLRCNGPVAALTPDLRNRMRERKGEILQFLRAAEAAAQQQPAIVPLQPRGGRIPVFGVAGHNGDVFTYRALAQCLGQDQPFFALRPPGLDSQTEPLARVEDLAAYFAGQMLTAHPRGPFIVAGYCAGGTIAFELAQQLQRRGASVAFVAMFGCPYPTMFRFTTAKLLPGRVAARARALTSLASLAEYRRYLAALGGSLRNQIAAVASPREEQDEVSVLRARLERTTVEAVRRYAPARFAGRVTLFLPNARWSRSAAKPLRWRAHAEHSDVHVGPDTCGEDTMLRLPAAQRVAELFARARDWGGAPDAAFRDGAGARQERMTT